MHAKNPGAMSPQDFKILLTLAMACYLLAWLGQKSLAASLTSICTCACSWPDRKMNTDCIPKRPTSKAQHLTPKPGEASIDCQRRCCCWNWLYRRRASKDSFQQQMWLCNADTHGCTFRVAHWRRTAFREQASPCKVAKA